MNAPSSLHRKPRRVHLPDPISVRSRLQTKTIGNLHKDDRGASYHLGFTILLPFFVLFIVFVVELALLLNSKMNVTYAAYAAARSATVWLAADDLPIEERLGMIHVAAVNALAPIASGRHAISGSGDLKYPSSAPSAWVQSYRKYARGGQDPEYLKSKWKYAARATRIRLDRDTTGSDSDIRVTVEYEYPFHTAGAGRLLGRVSPRLGANLRSRTVRSTVVMRLEGPRSESATLGIPFHATHGFRSRIAD